MFQKALDLAEPGDIIVVDAGGDLTNALMGELMLAHGITRGVAGFVINGAIRDVDAFVETNCPPLPQVLPIAVRTRMVRAR